MELPPGFDEHEVEELQVPDLEPCGLVEGFDQLLIQEECPHSQQELRTILFKERDDKALLWFYYLNFMIKDTL